MIMKDILGGNILIIQLEQARQHLKEMQPQLEELAKSLNISQLEQNCKELEAITSEADFWNDPERSQKVLGELKENKSTLDDYKELMALYESTLELLDMAIESEDESFTDDILADIKTIEKSYEEQRIKLLLSGEYDRSNAIVSIHPGAGGTEAQDWAEMLYRMYMRFSERQGFRFKVLDYLMAMKPESRALPL